MIFQREISTDFDNGGVKLLRKIFIKPLTSGDRPEKSVYCLFTDLVNLSI
jgi:hypothetical protein